MGALANPHPKEVAHDAHEMPPGRSLIAREAGLDSATLVLTAQLAQLGIVFGEHEFGSGERATMALSAQQAQLSIVSMRFWFALPWHGPGRAQMLPRTSPWRRIACKACVGVGFQHDVANGTCL